MFIGSGEHLLEVAAKWEAGSIMLKCQALGLNNVDLALLFTVCVTLARLVHCEH